VDHDHRRPDELSEEACASTFCTWPTRRSLPAPRLLSRLCEVKFFYEQTLERHWTTLQFVRPQHEKKLPVVLSREEVSGILAEVRIPVSRACLTV
jgi:site-specific recombinase XerD